MGWGVGGEGVSSVACTTLSLSQIGVAIKNCIARGEVTRDDLFVQSKLWNCNHRPEHVEVDLVLTTGSPLLLPFFCCPIFHSCRPPLNRKACAMHTLPCTQAASTQHDSSK